MVIAGILLLIGITTAFITLNCIEGCKKKKIEEEELSDSDHEDGV